MDLISRQDAIKATLEFVVEYLGGAFDIELQSELKKRLEQLPPAQPNKHLWFMVGETLVSESKRHITAEQAIERIRQYMQEA